MRIRLTHFFVGAVMASLGLSVAARAEDIRLKVIGGVAGVNQYVGLEEPFWTTEVGRLTGGRVSASIAPFDRTGMRAQDMLQLIRLGVAPFGTVLLSMTEADDPELNAIDLAGLNPDFALLRQHVSTFRPRLRAILAERYGIRLLAIYAYPAQVLYCAKPFEGLGLLRGRRIRTSSVTQSDLFSALGATTVLMPFSEIVDAVRKGAVDCAVTGTLSGNEIGLASITSHMSPMAITWGLSVFAANENVWTGLPDDVRSSLQSGLAGLEARIWASAEADTLKGIACNTGDVSCPPSRRQAMQLVPVSADDERLRRAILERDVLPRWQARCGRDCADMQGDLPQGENANGQGILPAGDMVGPSP